MAITPPLSFLNLNELEGLAGALLPQAVHDYYRGGSETLSTVQENTEIFKRIRLLPRILRNVDIVNARTRLWGMDLSFPVMIAPMAMHGMASPTERELGTARAAANVGIPFVLSTMATSSIEEVAADAASRPEANLVFQLYVIRNRDIVKGWVQQAEKLGYKALMITVDAPRLAKREADERNRFTLPEGLQLKNLAPLRALQASAAAASAAAQGGPAAAAPAAAEAAAAAATTSNARDNSEGSGLMKLFASEIDASLTWEFLAFLRSVTKLPVIIKGLLSPLDARLAVEHGVDGIVVSNHGGRQLDYAPSAMQMLPEVLREVHGRVPVLVDGGIRRGTDVLKAMAMGASGVLLGRPVLYALAVGGEAGVTRALSLLRAEFELAMALSGCRSVQEITRELLLLPPELSPACRTCAQCQSKI